MRKPNQLTTRILLAGAALLVSFAALPVRADYPTTVLSFNPVGYWRLSESVSPPAANIITNYGSLGAAADGYAYPGTSLAQGEVGVVGNSITFSNSTGGGNGYDAGSLINVPYNAALNPNGPFTVEFWGRPSTLARHDGDVLAAASSMNTSQSRSGWLIYHNTGGGSVGFDDNWELRMGGLASYGYTLDSPSGSAPAGVWGHVVAVFDGAFASLYLNGRLVAGPTANSPGHDFNPNNSHPFRIGAWDGAGFGRNFDGTLDEVAFYGSALNANSISNHYYVGTNNPAGYSAAVLANSPLGYWHLDEPVYVPPAQSTLPVTVNSGTLGTAANGTNQPGLTAGVAGPPFAGFPASNKGVKGVYSAGNANIGNPAGLNFTGPITMIAWVKPQYDDGLRNILSHGYQTDPFNAEVQMRINGGIYEVGSWNGTGEGSVSATGRATADIGNWVFLAGTFDGTDWRLYRYDQLIGGPNPGSVVGGALMMDAPWSIGSRGDTSSDGRFFGGWIDEAAIFTNALTAAQIQQIFYSAQMSPVILVAPKGPDGPVYEGSSLSFSVEAAGNPTLLYQWTKDSGPLSGQNGTSLALNNVTTGASGTYAIVVTNNYGSVTSSFVVTVIAGPPLLTLQPKDATRYAGATAAFSVGAVGSPTLGYQWYFNTNTSIGGATGTTYSKANVQAADAGKYNCRVTNPLGNSNSAYATLTIVPSPTTPYPVTALADNPVGYWRLDEASGTAAHDYWGGHDGIYVGAVTLGQAGYSSLDSDTAARFSAANTYVGSIGGIDFSGANSTFTVEAWVNGSPNQISGTDANATIIGKGRGGNGGGGVNGWQFVLDVSGGKYRLLVESTSAAGSATADVGPNGTWQHVVGVFDQAGGINIYVNGQPSGTAGTAPAGGPLPSTIPVSIGAGLGGVTPTYDMYFNGTIDEVAIYNKALTADQVRTHYCGQYGSGQRPLIAVQPASRTEWEGWPLTLSVSAAGSCDITYQWYKGPTPLTDGGTITGSQSNRLDIAGLVSLDAGNYTVRITNSAGSSNSAVAVINVLATPTNAIPAPGLVMHLKFDDTLTDSTGRGNNGTGQHHLASGTTAATPNAANPDFNYVTDGQLGHALHYATDAGPPGAETSAGTNDWYVTLGNRPDLQFSSNVNFTVSFWFRFPQNYDKGDLPFFANAVNSTGGKGFVFAPSYGINANFASTGPSGTWGWSISSTPGNFNYYAQGPDNQYSDGLWHHWVQTFNRNGSAILYIDGVQGDARSIVGAGDISTTGAASIGQDPTGAYAESGAADIDDLGVWRRVLTETEARGLYVAGTNGFSYVDINPSISAGPGAGQITVTWQVGTLQSANNVSGPYNDVPGATSPYTVAPAGQTFYRTRY